MRTRSLFILLQFCSPLKHLQVNSSYGYRTHPISRRPAFHKGIDLRAHRDTVYAITNGLVKTAAYQNDLGIYIILTHDQLQSVYGHLSQLFIGEGATVNAGQPIAITGSTGRVTGGHLHFGLLYQHRSLDPIKFLFQILKYQQHE